MWKQFTSLSLLALSSSALKKGVQPHSEPSVEKLGHRVHYDPEAANAPFWKSKFAAYEPLTYNIFNRFMKKDTIVFDVGAWVGLTALWEG